jgi:hypothetical protein
MHELFIVSTIYYFIALYISDLRKLIEQPIYSIFLSRMQCITIPHIHKYMTFFRFYKLKKNLNLFMVVYVFLSACSLLQVVGWYLPTKEQTERLKIARKRTSVSLSLFRHSCVNPNAGSVTDTLSYQYDCAYVNELPSRLKTPDVGKW